MPDTPQNNESKTSPSTGSDELVRQVADLQRQLVDARTETDETKRDVYVLLNQLFPYTPPTEEELNDMLHAPRGKPIIEVIAEYERDLKE